MLVNGCEYFIPEYCSEKKNRQDMEHLEEHGLVLQMVLAFTLS